MLTRVENGSAEELMRSHNDLEDEEDETDAYQYMIKKTPVYEKSSKKRRSCDPKAES